MTQKDLATRFAALHVKGNPVVLYNIWDAGSARAVETAGATAIATGSASVAAAHGYPDGEAIPLDLVESLVTRIAESINVPLSVDMEGGYAAEPDGVALTASRLIAAGAVGFNFEDQVVNGEGLYAIETQCNRLRAIRDVAISADIPVVLNARTDLFLSEPDRSKHNDAVAEAIERAAAYAQSGASSFFVPGLVDESLIENICSQVELPVNVMMMDGVPPAPRLAELGVARVSHGPGPYTALMETLTERARAALM